MILLKINEDDTRASIKDLNAIQAEIDDAGLISDWLKYFHMKTRF